MLLPHFDKLALIPYEALPQRNFRDIYIQEGEMYLTENGILGLPFTVDPLIMYWNRDIFSAAGLATYPRYWDEFSSLNRRLTAKDQNGNIRRSAVAMGEFTNVENAREIFGTLLLQLGNPVVIRTADGGFESAISVRAPVDPAPAIEFFTSFVDPSNPDYSWNRGLPSSKSAFLSGMLATYFGFSSELSDIRAKNPNLNFDAAPLPQLRAGGQKATYGRMYGFSIIRSSSNPNAVYQIVSLLSSPSYLSELSNSLYMPSVRRDLIAAGSGDPYISVFNEAALVSKSWFDAGPEASRQVFGTMIEAVTSGKKSVFEAVQDAGDRYDIILWQATQ
jgi:ABC-type glycerol-3-phosphate transport system substrate-binding protein